LPEVASRHPTTQRRRSERISKSLPVIVRGIDLLGQPFEERTSTLALNLHGCRYSSKHHLPKNTWVTLEVPQDAQRRSVRARVAWIQRPHSVQELFQIAVELESAANIWRIEFPPEEWTAHEVPVDSRADSSIEQYSRPYEEYGNAPDVGTEGIFTERISPDMTNLPTESAAEVRSTLETENSPATSPLLREWSAEIERQASRAADAATASAVEQVRQTVEEFRRAESAARESFAAQTAAKQEEFQSSLQSEFEKRFDQARALLKEIEREAQVLRAETGGALESISRLAQVRLEMEAVEAARAQQRHEDTPKEDAALPEGDAARWRERLEAEMNTAQAQWNELLQSSLDSNIDRVVTQLSGRSRELLVDTEQVMSERLGEIRQPLAQMYSEARETVTGVKSALDHEVARARSSLAEIEHAAGRMKEYSAQLEAASHDTLNELHRRLENILQTQTEEMNRRAENLAADVPQRLAPTLDSLGHQLVDRTLGEVEQRLGPFIERTSELLRELASRETEAEECLRLHRERLRQVSENNQREAAAVMAATLANLRNDFEAARKEALTRWNEELDASGVRASHAAAESIGRSSEWFQQEARARLQVLVEQTMETAGSSFEEATHEAARQFGVRLDEQSAGHLAQIHQQIDGVAGDVENRTRTRLDEAAEAAAASFGQVLRRVSEQEVENFTITSQGALAERQKDLASFAEQLLQNLEAGAGESMDRFRAKMSEQFQTTVAEGRGALAAELTSALDRYRAERDAHDKEWAEGLRRWTDETAEKYQGRLQVAGDSWVASSVRRLNEHGQTAIELLMRSADQSLRDSCSRLFQGLSEMLRDRSTNSSGPVGFTPAPTLEPEETSASCNELANGANA
jgi:hypothetical protein